MCRKIVEHHGGSIRLEHSAGPGSTFAVALPVLPDEAAGPTPPRSEEADHG